MKQQSPENTEVINPEKIYLAEIIQEVPMSTNNLCAPLIITVSDTIPLDTGCDARSISDSWEIKSDMSHCSKLLYPTYDRIQGIKFVYNFYPSGIKYLRNFIHCVKIISFP